MVKSGIVKSICRVSNTGIIEDAHKREFFFSIAECFENELPKLYSTVTFIRDPDFKSTNVACLIKSSEVGRKVG